MAYQSVLSALADPARRRILETLREGPRSVGQLAAVQPISRPAVSQHLKVLASAGLVTVEPKGTRHVYEFNLDGLEELRAYLNDFWSDVLHAYGAEIARNTERTAHS